jgi:hypothetical protein
MLTLISTQRFLHAKFLNALLFQTASQEVEKIISNLAIKGCTGCQIGSLSQLSHSCLAEDFPGYLDDACKTTQTPIDRLELYNLLQVDPLEAYERSEEYRKFTVDDLVDLF